MTGAPDLPPLQPLTRLQPAIFEALAVLKKAVSAGRKLAELKGLAASMPNRDILIQTLALQEAKDSSAIENIVTTHDELFRSAIDPDLLASAAAKEVRHYVQALRVGKHPTRHREHDRSTSAQRGEACRDDKLDPLRRRCLSPEGRATIHA